jgi:pimeloyl-ACP methyl ester carboxylesterase
MLTIVPFEIAVPDAVLDDLRQRIAHTRWADQISDSGWDYGTDPTYLRSLVQYWGSTYDWRLHERSLNALPQFQATIDGQSLHFVHARSESQNAIPLLLLHGWPSSFVQMTEILPLLTDTSANGSSFHVIVPSLPGYGFSGRPETRGMSVAKVGELLHTMMVGLGYERYVIRATDLGAGAATQIAITHPEAVIATHMSGTNPFVMNVPDNLSPAEEQFVQNAQQWMQTEMAYAQMHSSKPQTVAAALNDSPAGLASWIIEKFWRWGDHGGDIDTYFGRDRLLTNLTVYWVTQTINSSMRLYYETARDYGAWGQPGAPAAALQFGGDMFPTPREWLERNGPLARYTEAGPGGHFPEWEKPSVVATDLRDFIATLVEV